MQTAEYQITDEEKKMWDEYDKIMNEYYADCDRHNNRIMRAIKSVKGNAFCKKLLAALKDCEVKDKLMLVRKPQGKFQSVPYGRGIPGYWCVQWQTGTEGDSFAGFVTFKLKERLYLECRFEC